MLLPFFRTLLKYAQMDYDRRTLMNNLAQRFPRLLKANHAFFKLSKSKVRSSSMGFDKTDTSSRWALPGGPGVQTLTFSGTRYSHSCCVYFELFVSSQELLRIGTDMGDTRVVLNSKTSPELVLQWSIETTEQGKIIPHVRLLPRMHKKCKKSNADWI